VLSWLPDDSETLVVSVGKVPLGSPAAKPVLAPPTAGSIKYSSSESTPIPDPFGDPPYAYQDVVAPTCIHPLVWYSALYPADTWSSMVKQFFGTGSAILLQNS